MTTVPASAQRHYPTQPVLAVSMAVFRDHRVLIGQRQKPPSPSLYSLPGGVVELGEKLEDAALRELAEETHVEAEIINLAGYSDVIVRDSESKIERHYVIACFAARWMKGEGQACAEFGPLLWADEHDLIRLPLTHGLLDIITKARHLL
jgi:8-oxo-dGTP diphosphatase